jgi:hypothetical protein
MLVLTELRLAWRTPSYLVVALGIPVLLLIIFGSIPSLTKPSKEFGGVSFFTIYTPTLMVLVLIVLGLLSLPSQMASYRQQGVLHRMSTTPVPASALLGAQVAVNIGFALVSVALLLGVGAGTFNLILPVQFGWFVLSLTPEVPAVLDSSRDHVEMMGRLSNRHWSARIGWNNTVGWESTMNLALDHDRSVNASVASASRPSSRRPVGTTRSADRSLRDLGPFLPSLKFHAQWGILICQNSSLQLKRDLVRTLVNPCPHRQVAMRDGDLWAPECNPRHHPRRQARRPAPIRTG